MRHVFVINGSASEGSTNHLLIQAIEKLARDRLTFTIFSGLKLLPHFDPALTLEHTPKPILDLRKRIEKADGLLICTPEYVMSIPSGLKNAIEWCHAISDTKGYYEIALPYGAITYYATAYEKDYGQGKVVMGLSPSDDNTAGFASESGQVKNFVLQSYGLGKQSEVSAQPGNATNYYGGAISFDYNIDWDGNMPTYLPKNGMIEITLVPDGPGLFGETRTFIVSKTIGVAGLAILNIPVGKYAISAKLVGGTALNMEEVGPYAGSYPLWGLKPAGPTANATIMFTPNFQYTVQMAVAHKSNWQSVKVNLSR